MLEEMDDEFGVSNVVNEAFGDVTRRKIKKEPVSCISLLFSLPNNVSRMFPNI